MIINSLWIGDRLSRLEHACIKSHIIVGHEYHLWCYNPIENVPEGVVLRDGREILPEKDIFAYRVGDGKGSYSAFSNYFRYKLLLVQGGWWADTDVAALKEWVFTDPYVIASEATKHPGGMLNHPTTCVIHAPMGSDLAQICWEQAQFHDKNTLEWSTIGPLLLATTVERLGLEEFVVHPHTFCPINWTNYDKLLYERARYDLYYSFGIHFWNEMWRRGGVNKECEPWSDSPYGKLLHDVSLSQGICQLLQACNKVSSVERCPEPPSIL